jgi:hypothetical protein
MEERVAGDTLPPPTFHELACCYNRRTLGGFFDQSRHRLRMRHKDRVAALDLGDHRTRALRHLPLGVGWNHLVLGRKHQLGFAFHAGSLIVPFSAFTPHGRAA